MAIRLEATRRFEAESPVARYWLTQCKGFRVRGARKGTVQEIVSRSDPYVPELLVVRNVYRRREIPVSEVEAVVPAEQLIVLGEPIAAGDDRRQRRRVRAAARIASRPVVSGGRVVVEHGRPAARRLGRGSRRIAVAAGLTLVAFGRLARSLGLGVRRVSARAAAFGMAAFRACRGSAVLAGGVLVSIVRLLGVEVSAVVRGATLAARSSVEAFQARRRVAATARPAAGWKDMRSLLDGLRGEAAKGRGLDSPRGRDSRRGPA